MDFLVKRVLPDKESVFIVGDTYTATITEMDFKYKGVDSMEIYLRDNRVDMDGLWSTNEFNKEFCVVECAELGLVTQPLK